MDVTGRPIGFSSSETRYSVSASEFAKATGSKRWAPAWGVSHRTICLRPRQEIMFLAAENTLERVRGSALYLLARSAACGFHWLSARMSTGVASSRLETHP